MTENAYIKLVPESVKVTVTIEDVKELLNYYQMITAKTGKQLDWDYEKKAFPYEMKVPERMKDKAIYLQSNEDRYHMILIGVDQEVVRDEDGLERIQSYIQFTLPETATSGDKGKANELCKFLAKKLRAQLHLFNNRVMYYYPRK
ncbi:RecJ-like exonuclease [Peribacillus simplex]